MPSMQELKKAIWSDLPKIYEQKHGIEVSRTMVISPMVDDLGKRVAQDLGIEVYSYADTVTMYTDQT